MASEQREKERMERKQKKNKKKRLIAWIVIGVVVVVLLVMRIAEIDFSSIADGSAFSASQESSFPYELQSGSDLYFGSVGNSLCVLEDTTYTVLDDSDAQERLSFSHGYSNPIIRTAGGYSLLYDQGGISFRLDNSSENIYQNKADHQILCAGVSDSGTAAVCTTSDENTSLISVYNRSMSLKFSYGTSVGYITSVAVDSRGSRVAFAAVSSENARFKTVVYTMNIDDEEPRAQFEYIGSSVLDLRFSSTDLFVVGNDFVSIIESLSTENKIYEQGSVSTVNYSYSSDGALLYAYTAYSGSSDNNISVVKSSGRVTEVASVNASVKDVTGTSSRVSVLTAENVTTYKVSDSEVLNTYSVDDSYTSIQQISSEIFARRQAVVVHLTQEQE